jgi:DNA-directed RNA polymerase specialized sigma24 family protein
MVCLLREHDMTSEEQDVARLFDRAGMVLEQAWHDVVEAADDERERALHAAIQTTSLLVLTGEVTLGRAFDEYLYVEAAYHCGVHVREIRQRLAGTMVRLRVNAGLAR